MCIFLTRTAKRASASNYSNGITVNLRAFKHITTPTLPKEKENKTVLSYNIIFKLYISFTLEKIRSIL